MITFYINLEDAIDVLNKHIIDETLKNIILADEGVVINSNICYETIYNILLFCFIHNTMFDEKQFNNLDNILKKILSL